MRRRHVPTFESVDDVHEFVDVLLHRIDQRYTVGRRSVVELLASSERPLSISDIEAQLPAIPRSSAYRHLSDLQRAGVVRRIAVSYTHLDVYKRQLQERDRGVARRARTGETRDPRPGREVAFTLKDLLQLRQHEDAHLVDHVAQRGVAIERTWLRRDLSEASGAEVLNGQEKT